MGLRTVPNKNPAATCLELPASARPKELAGQHLMAYPTKNVQVWHENQADLVKSLCRIRVFPLVAARFVSLRSHELLGGTRRASHRANPSGMARPRKSRTSTWAHNQLDGGTTSHTDTSIESPSPAFQVPAVVGLAKHGFTSNLGGHQ